VDGTIRLAFGHGPETLSGTKKKKGRSASVQALMYFKLVFFLPKAMDYGTFCPKGADKYYNCLQIPTRYEDLRYLFGIGFGDLTGDRSVGRENNGHHIFPTRHNMRVLVKFGL
jgi:hypothetical protein